MKQIKRIIAGSLAIVMTFAFAGCTDNGDSESSRRDSMPVVSTDDIKPIADG